MDCNSRSEIDVVQYWMDVRVFYEQKQEGISRLYCEREDFHFFTSSISFERHMKHANECRTYDVDVHDAIDIFRDILNSQHLRVRS